MYEQVEKPKENKSVAVANSVAQKKSNVKQGFGLVDNRPEAIAQRKILEMSKNSIDSNQSVLSQSAIQLFAVPAGLQSLKNEVVNVSDDIQKNTLSDGTAGGDPLYGSEEWGKDTYWAANRKLDEWNLVKELVAGGSSIQDATHIGFGINDTTEADGVGYDSKNNVGIAGENKIVSGGFPQIVENINSALSQLTEGTRAGVYNGVPLIARVNVSEGSNAFKHLNSMSDSVKKAMTTRWKNRLKNAYEEGLSNWKGKSSLRLWILTKNNTLFDETISKEL